jgi:hypothetical protein
LLKAQLKQPVIKVYYSGIKDSFAIKSQFKVRPRANIFGLRSNPSKIPIPKPYTKDHCRPNVNALPTIGED